MKKKTIIVNTEIADLELYEKELKKAMKCNWNSLYFSKNRDEFLSLLFGDKVFTLTTIGDTVIKDEHGILYRNDNQDEIRYLIKDGELDRCVIRESNRFVLIIERVIGQKSGVLTTVYEDILPYKGQPMTINELEDEILHIASEYIGIQKNNLKIS